MVQRSFKRRIDICFIGSTGDFFDIKPINKNRKSEIALMIKHGAFDLSLINTTPIGENRRNETPIALSSGALYSATSCANLPNIKYGYLGKKSSAGGAFSHTHIKSKL